MDTEHEKIVEILKIGMMMEKERFKEVELFICKGRQLQMKDFVNHLKVCVDSIDYDLNRNVDPKDVLETSEIISGILSSNFSGPNVLFFKSRELRVMFDKPVAWTRDGEDGGCHRDVYIHNCHPGVEIIV